MHNQWDGWEPLSSAPVCSLSFTFPFVLPPPAGCLPVLLPLKTPEGLITPTAAPELQREGKWATLKGTFAFHQTLCHQTHKSLGAAAITVIFTFDTGRTQ